MKYPLSQTQLEVVAMTMKNEGEGSYNCPWLNKLDNEVDLPRLIKALQIAGDNHPMIKARLEEDESGMPVFVDHSDEPIVVSTVKLSDEKELFQHIRKEYDLFSEPLYRFEICKTGDGNYLYTDFFHIVTDGYSYQLFFNDVSAAYSGKSLLPETISGFEFNQEEIDARKMAQYDADKEYFREVFGGADECAYMPTPDKYPGEEEHFSSYSKVLNIDSMLLGAFCEREKIGESRLFTAAFGYLLSKYNACDEVIYSTVYNSRGDKRLANTVNMCVRTLPVYQNFEKTTTVSELISDFSSQLSETRKHTLYSYSECGSELGIHSDAMFVYHGKLHTLELVLDGKKSEGIDPIVNTPGFEFMAHLNAVDGKYVIKCEYAQHRFSEKFIVDFCDAYGNVVSQMMEKEQLSEIEICTKEQLQELDSFNCLSYPDEGASKTVVSLFSRTAKEFPEIDAIVYKDNRYSYRELDEMTDILACHFNACVPKKDKQGCISILIPRNEYMAIVPLAAMKAGFVFQPLDPNYPAERLNFMVKDADASLVVADPSLKDVLTDYKGEILLTTEIEEIIKKGKIGNAPDISQLTPSQPEDAFIYLYTSGSTGTPKGVVLEQRNLATYCLWYKERYPLMPGDSVACYASFGFDVHMSEIYGGLTNGLTCHIIPEEIRLDLISLNDYFERNDIKKSILTTAIATQFAINIENKSLKYLVSAGEKLISIDPPKNYLLVNGYGPTEATIYVTAKSVLEREENIPIGKPHNTVRCYVTDKFRHRLPIGAIGELVIAGPQVGREYLNRPDKTAEVFIKDPFYEGDSDYFGRAYRSGDLTRFRKDGDIEYLGRKDTQIKIHGYRIELKEIEAVIREYEKINDVTVQVFEDTYGEKHIAAYVVSDDEINAAELCEFIASKKPAYMVPEAVVQIEEIPLNTNFKVDKKKLPNPKQSDVKVEKKSMTDAPLNVLECKIADIIASVIGTKEIGITDSLSNMGLNSISAIRLATQIYKEYGVQLKMSELLETGTLQSIENAILTSILSKDDFSENKSLEKTVDGKTDNKKISEKVPLSFEQKGVYAECQKAPDTTLYNIPFSARFPKGIEPEDLKKAVQEVVMAHPSFTLCFEADENNEIVQYFNPEYEPEIAIKRMDADELIRHRKEFVRPFSLAGEALARFEIIDSDELYLFVDTHHLISDGMSNDIFFKEVCACLEGVAPQKEEYTYLEHVQNEEITSETEAFFEKQMADCGEITQLLPDVYEQVSSHAEGIVRFNTDLKAVCDFAAQQKITPAGVFLAAEFIALARYTSEDFVAISTISGGRSDLRIHNTLGMFINTLPLCTKIDNSEETLAFVKRVSEDFAATIENEHYPFSLIAKKYDFHPSVSYTYQVGVLNKYSVNGEKIELEDFELEQAKLPVSVYIMGDPEEGGFIQVNYDKALFSERMMFDFARSIHNVVCGLMTCKTLSQISLTDEEQWAMLDSYNRPFDLNYDRTDTAVSLFRKQANESPDKVAAVYKEKSYTFRQLDELTDRLAEVLYEVLTDITGLTSLAEQVVSIIISRSENAFILPLAVLKTGCAYEPLDPDYPADRLNFMIKDSGAKLILAQKGLDDIVNESDCKIMLVEELYERAENGGNKNAKVSALDIPAPKPEDLLIMLYTSGTTGMPKGVQLLHGNLVAFTHGSKLDGLYTKESRTATYASFGFDVNMADTFCTMLNGGTIILIPEEERMNLGALAEYFDKEKVTDVLLTTQVGVQFINSYPKLQTLRMLTVGGEKLPAINTDELSYTVYNGYGPTENCAGVSIFPIRKWEPNIPIGKPVQTINAYVLDKTGHRLPAGAAGEYCLSGPQVARCYLNRPDKTAEAFEKCPFNDFNMYHTGDIVRYRQNGDVEFVGRKDGQVKIRGFRVELKEVEAVILGYEGIKDVTVQAYDFENGGKYLAAFVVCEGLADTKAIAAYIRERKPAYMVPAVIMQIDEVPLTVNRKVDKKALPKPELQKAEFVAPATKAEEDFCNIFGEVIGIERVGAEDDFFELGGSSISAMKVVLAAGKAGYEIVYQNVFDFSTPRLLAEYACKASSDDEIIMDLSKSEEKANSGDALSYVGPDGYDYSAINELLCKNTLEAFKRENHLPIGDVFLTGPTGFLGIHVLHDLLVNATGKVWCLTRSKGEKSAENRLKEYLKYYFNDSFDKLFGSRIFVVEGDALDSGCLDEFNPQEKNITVINCAANVAHFAKGDTIERTNVGSVENLIDWCIKHSARLVHISTGSVVGSSKNGVPADDFRLDEHALYKGQIVDNNQYIYSKFIGERTIYEAILERGLSAKVMRVSNLSPRFDDGTVQINYETNNALCTLKAYKTLGFVSYDMLGIKTEYSPIDYVARAVLSLATTPEACICFNLANDFMPYVGDVITRLSSQIRLVEPEELGMELTKALNDPAKEEIMRPLLAYSNNKKDGDTHLFGFEAVDSSYTAQLLYRLGFRWPVTDGNYVERFAKKLEDLKFF